MKLFRFGDKGAEKPGMLALDGSMRDLSAHISDISPETLGDIASLGGLDAMGLPMVPKGARLGACLSHTPNFYCIGLNYRAHAAESGMAEPKSPVIFSKASSALAGPFDTLSLPFSAQKGDWEVELGVVIGREAYQVSKAGALAHIAGYCLINDLSERAFQLEGSGQWIRGKSLPGFGPVGPYFVSADEVANPQDLRLWLTLNGTMMQESNTADMIFSVAEIIADMSKYMMLKPGDIISTGTPSGVGMGQKPQRWLRDGDVMELGIDGLGAQRTVVEHG